MNKRNLFEAAQLEVLEQLNQGHDSWTKDLLKTTMLQQELDIIKDEYEEKLLTYDYEDAIWWLMERCYEFGRDKGWQIEQEKDSNKNLQD